MVEYKIGGRWVKVSREMAGYLNRGRREALARWHAARAERRAALRTEPIDPFCMLRMIEARTARIDAAGLSAEDFSDGGEQ